MNRKGNVGFVIFLFLAMATLILGGMALAFGSIILDWTFDEVVPEVSNLGVIHETNMTQVAEYSISPVNGFVQQLPWLGGVAYILALLVIFGLAFAYRFTSEKALIPLYIMLVVLLVMMCILVSNIYEEFYNGDDEMGSRLKEHLILSYMIVNSPAIMGLISLLAGIIMFSGPSEEVYV